MDRPQIYQQPQMATMPHYGVKSDKVILATPTWMAAIRGLQILFSIIIFGLCAWTIHSVYLDCDGLAIAVVSFLRSLQHRQRVSPHGFFPQQLCALSSLKWLLAKRTPLTYHPTVRPDLGHTGLYDHYREDPVVP